jgi:uncharacterized membrane protein
MIRAAVVLGIGIGGFFDGIVFHQILQWHHVVSSVVVPDTVSALELNTLADGLFHGATWIVTVVGVWLLVRARSGRGPISDPDAGRPARRLLGAMLAGWGGFNVVEGLVDHYLLAIHHVRPGPDVALYDAAFLLWGALFLVLGAALVRDGRASDPLRAP